MTVAEAINTIIKQHGVEILGFPNRVQAMIMDYAGNYEREVQLFCLPCQKGLLRYAQIIVHLENDTDIRDIALKAKVMLQNEAFMDEKYAIQSINMLLNGLGFTYEIVSDIHERGTIEEKRDKVTTIRQLDHKRYSVSLTVDNRIEIDGNLLQDLRESARKGNVNALLSLGNCYFHGIAVTEDWIIAESYYRKAKELGNNDEKKEATSRLNEIYNKRQLGF